MRLKILLFLIGFPAFFAKIYAQQAGCTLTVSGHIYISDTTQLDARGATIRFPGLKKGGVTDNDGNFNITDICPGKTRIVVSYSGYKTLDTVFNITHDLTLNFLLFSNTQELSSVTVVGEILKKDQITTAIKSVLSGAALDA